MSIIGIESLIYGVGDVEKSCRFFEDFGLRPIGEDFGLRPIGEDFGLRPIGTGASLGRFALPEGSHVLIRHRDDPLLPQSSLVGDGVREVIWGVDTEEALEALAAGLSSDRQIIRDADGTARFLTDFGLAMGLRPWARKPILSAPDPLNAPGNVRRLNQQRKWRLRAYPKAIAHVVFAIPDYEAGYAFMRDRLGFRLSDNQRGFGMYLRADGTNNHHNLLLLNASAPFPGMDGMHRFHHANFALEDIDEIMVGANYMLRRGWEPSHLGLGRHRVDSALFYYLPCPAGGEAEYGADADYVDDAWVPRDWHEPLFAYAHFVHNLPPFLMKAPAWDFSHITGIEPAKGGH